MQFSSKNTYIHFLNNTNIEIPIFFQPWYLDIVCSNGKWDVIVCEDNSGFVLGFWVYYTTKKNWQPVITMPPFTPYAGIWICSLPSKKTVTKNKKTTSIIRHLIERFPKDKTFYSQSFHYSFQNCLPLYWKKYIQTVRYTFYIDKLQDWSIKDIASNVRNIIKKASTNLHYEVSEDVEVLYKLFKQTIEAKKINLSFSQELFIELDNAVVKNSERRIIIIKDELGSIHAATYTIIDKDCAYLILLGSNLTTRHNGAASLAIYHSILEVQPLVKHFDFEGSMLESMFGLFAGFGGELKPYYRFYKAKNIFWDILYRIKNHYDKNIR